MTAIRYVGNTLGDMFGMVIEAALLVAYVIIGA